ncbi:hypothetical protein [Vogesella indigofera]|uniref:hypothetical protein n=1 Tax=Vogesella indigofera TaxID=45465 RepID=UPI003F42EB29
MKKTQEIFGIQPALVEETYVDRGHLDNRLATLLARTTHVALRGESKCGKSWLRQRVVGSALVAQCRHQKTMQDIYVEILSQLQVDLILEATSGGRFVARVEASGEVGNTLLAKLAAKLGLDFERNSSLKTKPVGKNETDLKFFADLVLESGYRLVIEDFHYLSKEERAKFAFDLKALWDYGLYVVVVGVWGENNMLLALNPDLSGRIEEISLTWNSAELQKILEQGGRELNIVFSDQVANFMAEISYGSPGVCQQLALGMLDSLGIFETSKLKILLDKVEDVEIAAKKYAEQLTPLYQSFARRVSEGIRRRKGSTGIYAHALDVILNANDYVLVNGYGVKDIYTNCHEVEPRIRLPNLRSVLRKFESLQIDSEGRGLIVAYNDQAGQVYVVDRQLLLYRRFKEIDWPWQEVVSDCDQAEFVFDGDEE